MSDKTLSTTQIGYQKFQIALLDGRLRPGQFVNQRKLGSMLELSVSGLREILPRLQAEGLLLVQPKRGIQIPVIDLVMIRNAFQMRAALEREAVLHAVRAMPNDMLEHQRQRHQEILDALEISPDYNVPDAGQIVDANFHTLLLEATGNDVLQQSYNINAIRIRLIRLDRIQLTRSTLPDAFSDHLAVIDAILMRDAHRAVDAMDNHISNARNRAMEL